MKTHSFVRPGLVHILVCSLAAAAAFGAAPKPETVTVEPRESDEVLANPGMGWQTFHSFADEDKNLQGVPSASAYFRFYWREVEKQEGQIDFARFDELLAHARRAGQKLAFRIMCTGSGQYMDVPEWLKAKGCKGTDFEYGGRKHWVPDFVDPLFQKAHFGLIRQLGRRYDGHPDLDLMDIGSVGLWGEWHMSSTKALDSGKPVPLPSMEMRKAIIEAWCSAFPTTPKVVLIGSDEGMTMTATKGIGWRADCLGDMGGFSKTWNHMDKFYLQEIAKTGAEDVWRIAPVAYESCWDMRKWKEENWDIRYIFDYALKTHASYLNNKSAPIPEGTRPEIERFLKQLGYRLVLRRVEHPASVHAGSDAQVMLTCENVGVAPPYRDDHLAFRLTSKEAVEPIKIVTENSIRGWMPGPQKVKVSLKLPKDVAPGRYDLAIGIVPPGSQTPAVRLANTGRDSQGWHPLSQVEIPR